MTAPIYAPDHGATERITAFNKFYERHVDQVYKRALTRSGNRQITEDATVETFVRALRHVYTGGNWGGDPLGWLLRTAESSVLDVRVVGAR